MTAAALIALTACSSSSSDDKPTPSVDMSSIQSAAGIPAKPEGTARTTYLAAIKAVDPTLVADPDKAIDAGRNQCGSIATDQSGHLAAERFGNDAHPLTDTQGQALNAALKATLCH